MLYTPSYVKNATKEWNAVLALCPKSLAVMTTVSEIVHCVELVRIMQGLRKLINEMFEAPFTSSSVGVTFYHYWNTLTVGIPDDESTRNHRIQFSITPPTVIHTIKDHVANVQFTLSRLKETKWTCQRLTLRLKRSYLPMTPTLHTSS